VRRSYVVYSNGRCFKIQRTSGSKALGRIIQVYTETFKSRIDAYRFIRSLDKSATSESIEFKGGL
jgi:hypothetical protein